MSIETLKLKLIYKIYSLDNLAELQRIEKSISVSRDFTLKNLNRPMRKQLDVEQLKKEQNWTPTDNKKMFKLMDDIKVEEPLVDLLKMI